MRVLLDERVDQRLAGDIRGYDAVTMPTLTNGGLMARAQQEFDFSSVTGG